MCTPTIAMDATQPCRLCFDPHDPVTGDAGLCPDCERMVRDAGDSALRVTCTVCAGTGREHDGVSCWDCDGTGMVYLELTPRCAACNTDAYAQWYLDDNAGLCPDCME